MPDMVRIFSDADTLHFLYSIRRIEQTELYTCRMLGEKSKVDAFPIPCGTERVRGARPLGDSVPYSIHSPIPFRRTGSVYT